MSATNRGAVRNPRDFYKTPIWCIAALTNEVRPLDDHRVLDAGAGDGRIGYGMKIIGADVTMIDIEPQLPHVQRADFLAEGFSHPDCDLVVSNPPYRLAEQFLEVAMRTAPAAAFLVRLNFLGSSKRVDLFRRFPPAKIITLTPRPSFTPDGSTDATEYSWIWFGSTRLLYDYGNAPFAWAVRSEIEGEAAA